MKPIPGEEKDRKDVSYTEDDQFTVTRGLRTPVRRFNVEGSNFRILQEGREPGA